MDTDASPALSYNDLYELIVKFRTGHFQRVMELGNQEKLNERKAADIERKRRAIKEESVGKSQDEIAKLMDAAEKDVEQMSSMQDWSVSHGLKKADKIIEDTLKELIEHADQFPEKLLKIIPDPYQKTVREHAAKTSKQ
ncbi:hypothetical protein EC988_002155 [Linderina pennispora]|nr:hypothetical protein EC988_002155 [Linderina pennispora]